MAQHKSNYVPRGRYSNGGGTIDHGTRLGWWEMQNFPKSHDDLRVIIRGKYVRRPDLLAYDVYGQAGMMWLVLQYNNILDMQEEFVDGLEITLPTKSRVMTEITAHRPPAPSE